MKHRKILFLSLLSSLLLSPAWYSWGSVMVLFIAFVPFLFVEKILSEGKKPGLNVFLYSILTFSIWNLLTTWWIKNATFPGMIVAVLVNTLLMSFTFWLFSLTRKRLGNKIGYFSLIFYWITYEYFYLHGEISWTWLNLGNGFANNIRLIQWYEYTGTLGGTLWVLLVNILIYRILSIYLELRSLRSLKREVIFLSAILLIPALFSIIRFHTYREKTDPYEILVIQPNIDPYQKFNDIPPHEQMMIFIKLADSLVSPETDYIVVPETFVNNNVWLDQLEENPSIRMLREFQQRHPQTMMVIGATTYKIYKSPEEATATARPLDSYFFDSFNSALQIDSTDLIQVYHKSQLVVGVEKMPYPDKLGFLRSLTVKLGGTFRSHGIQYYRDTFVSPSGECRVAPVICYESVFGQYVTEYVSKAGANFIFVITNDGWWGDTPGYVQHNSFSSLRAIETRRSIARSANTGISSFINQKGEILQSLPWWKRDAIRASLNANDKLSYYVRHGDFIGRISAFMGIFTLLCFIVRGFFLPR